MCFNPDRIAKRAIKVILNEPYRIEESYSHRPGARYVRIKGYRVYFHKENEKIIIDAIYSKPWWLRLLRDLKRGF